MTSRRTNGGTLTQMFGEPRKSVQVWRRENRALCGAKGNSRCTCASTKPGRTVKPRRTMFASSFVKWTSRSPSSVYACLDRSDLLRKCAPRPRGRREEVARYAACVRPRRERMVEELVPPDMLHIGAATHLLILGAHANTGHLEHALGGPTAVSLAGPEAPARGSSSMRRGPEQADMGVYSGCSPMAWVHLG